MINYIVEIHICCESHLKKCTVQWILIPKHWNVKSILSHWIFRHIDKSLWNHRKSLKEKQKPSLNRLQRPSLERRMWSRDFRLWARFHLFCLSSLISLQNLIPWKDTILLWIYWVLTCDSCKIYVYSWNLTIADTFLFPLS